MPATFATTFVLLSRKGNGQSISSASVHGHLGGVTSAGRYHDVVFMFSISLCWSHTQATKEVKTRRSGVVSYHVHSSHPRCIDKAPTLPPSRRFCKTHLEGPKFFDKPYLTPRSTDSRGEVPDPRLSSSMF